MTESMISAGIRCVLDNCPGATEDGARYAIVSFLNTLKEPDEGMVEAGGSSVLEHGSIDPAHVDDRWYGPKGWTYGEEPDSFGCLQGRETGSARIWSAMISHILKESESK